jgi:hypothetical protein
MSISFFDKIHRKANKKGATTQRYYGTAVHRFYGFAIVPLCHCAFFITFARLK